MPEKVMVELIGWNVTWVNEHNWLTTLPVRDPVTAEEAKRRVFAERPEAAGTQQVGKGIFPRFRSIEAIINDPR